MVPLKPADVAVALQLWLTPEAPYRALAEAVGVSHGEAHNAVQRLQAARLLRAGSRSVKGEALLEFLFGGVPYAFAATPGAEVRGVPTAHTAPPLSIEFDSADAYVWPSAKGLIRGAALEPLCRCRAHGDGQSRTVRAVVPRRCATRRARARATEGP